MRTSDEAESLFMANKEVAYAVLRRFGHYYRSGHHWDHQEAEQVALIAAWQACVNHDAARGKLSTVIHRYATTALLNYRLRARRFGAMCGIVAVPKDHHAAVYRVDDAGWLSDDRFDDAAVVDDRDEHEHRMALVREASRKVRAVSPMHRKALDLLATGLPNDEVADAVGAAKASVKEYRTTFYRDVRRVLALDARAERSKERRA